MRVLMVSRGVLTTGRRSGGAELVAFELARHIALREHDVTLIADVELSMFDNAPRGLSVRRMLNGRGLARLVLLIPFTFPRWLGQHLVGNWRAARCAIVTLREHYCRFDVVHTHGALATIMIARAMRRSKIAVPLVYTEHDSTPWMCVPRGGPERLIRKILYRSINLRACRHASLVATSYAALSAELTKRTGLPPEHFAVVPNGTDLERFVPADDSIVAYAQPGPDRYCLFVGSLIERKAPDLLLHALAQAKSDLGLVIIGEGPMAHDLRRLARRLALADRVLFMGAQPQEVVHRYYQKADFLVLPSVSETAPLVLIEALSTGKPVVATDLQGISSIVRHEENGLLVPPGDAEALSTALSLLANDEELYARLVSNASESVRHFSWQAIARQLHLLYAKESDPDSTTSGVSHATKVRKDMPEAAIPASRILSTTKTGVHEEESMNV